MVYVPETESDSKLALEQAISIISNVQWAGDFCDEPACPICFSRPHEGHTTMCALADFLRRYTC